MAWNAFVAIRCNGKLNDSHWQRVKEWSEVKKIWSTMGDWDFWVETNSEINNTDNLEQFVFKLRKEPWVESTCARWWKEV